MALNCSCRIERTGSFCLWSRLQAGPVLDVDHVRLRRIAGKLAAARAMPVPPEAFGVEGHAFKLGAPLPEAVVTEFEERHEVALPPAYRLFVTGLGDGGAGPGYHLSSLSTFCRRGCLPGHLARASPYLPGPRYLGDWEQRYEDQTGGVIPRSALGGGPGGGPARRNLRVRGGRP